MSNEKELQLKDGERLHLLVNMLEPTDAYTLVARLGKVLLPAIVALKQGKSDELQTVVNTMFDQLGPETASLIRDELFKSVTATRFDAAGNPTKRDLLHGRAAINATFRSNLKAMFQTIAFAAEVNFGDFFDVSALAARMTPTPSA